MALPLIPLILRRATASGGSSTARAALRLPWIHATAHLRPVSGHGNDGGGRMDPGSGAGMTEGKAGTRPAPTGAEPHSAHTSTGSSSTARAALRLPWIHATAHLRPVSGHGNDGGGYGGDGRHETCPYGGGTPPLILRRAQHERPPAPIRLILRCIGDALTVGSRLGGYATGGCFVCDSADNVNEMEVLCAWQSWRHVWPR